MSEDLTRLGPDAFEQLVLALAVHILGPGITAFGDGPDGGREATFSRRQQYPNAADPWDGYGILQAKYKDQLFGSGPDATWFLGQVKDELDDWADPDKRRVSEGRRPEYLIFATNVPLSAVPGRGGRDKTDELIEKYRETLNLKGWDVWDGNQIKTYLNAYPDVKRPFTALMTPSDALAAQTVMLGVALETRGAEDATGRLARLRERTVALPAVARPAVELALAENPADTEQILSAVTDPAALPAQTLKAWVDTPPAFLGTPDALAHAAAWALLGEIAAAYGLHRHACTAFEYAVSAGSARRPYLLARAAWSALQAGDMARAASIAPPASLAPYAEAAYDLIAAFTALAAETVLDGGSQQLREQLRHDLAAWNPERPVDLDMQARITAEIEMSDPSGSARARHNAALQTLDNALARGWLDDTALAAATILRSRAAIGAADRAADLDRAVQLATRVRDAWRGARRDSTLAVRVAVAAASDAGRYRQVIAIGSAAFGQATGEEARDPEVAKQVILAAAKGIPEIADELAADPGQVPEGFLRAWAQALLALRGTQISNVMSHDELIGLWQQALAEATTVDERLQAFQGLATVGAYDLPGLDELLASDPANAAELHARAALARDDPDAAVNLLHPHRNASASVASILGEAYARLGQIDAAVDTLTAAASRFDHDDLIIQAASACTQAGDPARAERLLTDVLQTAAAGWAGRGRARTLLGELQADRGAWPEAIASWDSALEEDPYLDSARWQLSYAHASRGDHERAWAVLKGAPGASDETPLPSDPPTPNAAHLALVLLRRNGDFHAAVAYGLRYLSLFGSDERFAGRTLALLTLPTSEQDDSRQATLGAELQGRLEQGLAGFFARYPDSQYLRRRAGQDAADLADQLNHEARPGPQQAAYARALMTAVMRGTHPLGVLAALSSRPYAHCIVTRVAGVLSAEGGDDEHNAGIADARAVLSILPATPSGTTSAHGAGRENQAREPRLRTSVITPTAAAVTDTTALHVRALLPEMADVLTRGFRVVRLADSAYADIVAARDELYLPTAGTWVVDQATGQGGLIPVDSDTQSRQRSEIDVIYTLAGECRRMPMPVTDSSGLERLNGPGFDPWAGALRIAAAHGSALWADDIALRRLARSQGIPAFSTLSLLDAYASIGLVQAGQREEAIRRLIRGYVGDFPPDDRRLRTLAAAGSNDRGAVCSATAKPAFWTPPATALPLYNSLCTDLNAAAPAILPDLLRASTLGILRTDFSPTQREGLCAGIAAATINTAGPLGDVPRVLQALRIAQAEADPSLPDILPAAVRHLLRAFQRAFDIGNAPDSRLAADHVTALFARCLPQDQSTVRRTILSSP